MCFFFQAEDGIRDVAVTGVQTCALPIFTLLDEGQRAWAYGAARAETQQSARVAMARLTAEIRGAGRGGQGFAAVALAAPEQILLQQDLDRDRVIAARGERVTWRHDGPAPRRAAGAGAPPRLHSARALPGVCRAMAHSAMAHSMDLPRNHRPAAPAAGRAIGLRIISPLTFELALPVLEGRLARALPGYFGLLRYLDELDAPLPDGFDPLGELPRFAPSRSGRALVISPAPDAPTLETPPAAIGEGRRRG